MAALASPAHPVSIMRDEHVMDTRTPSPVQRANSSTSSEGDYKPDLSAEVALLSTKLVNAINYQTNLDDTLQHTRHELEHSRQRCEALDAENRRLMDMIASGELLKRSEVDGTVAGMKAELATERAARDAAERAKKQTEGEVETLTSALFEEANTMVAAARKDVEVMEKRNSQLRGQLSDTETLMESQQQQLRDLKSTMEKIQAEATISRPTSMPSTPIAATTAAFESLHHASLPTLTTVPDFRPDHPLHFFQLVTPVMRHDTTAYGEFLDLLLLTRRLGAHSRTNSNSATPQASSTQTSLPGPSSSSPSMPGGFSLSANSSPSSSAFGGSSTVPPLKESRFYKRVLTEDLEPTLRLDMAPGLSFLSRRTVLSSLLNGTLAVEPYPQNKHYYACALCGESRRSDEHVRKYRFRTSEDDSVPKPLCDYCLGRLRSTCDFVGFLRLVRDGHWKCDSEEEHRSAWDESVRLRERMFWARLGGGVVPSFQMLRNVNIPPTPSSATGIKSNRPSLEDIPESKTVPGTPVPEDLEIGATGATGKDESVEHTASISPTISGTSVRADATALPELGRVSETGMQRVDNNNSDPAFITPPSSTPLRPINDEQDIDSQLEPPRENDVVQGNNDQNSEASVDAMASNLHAMNAASIPAEQTDMSATPSEPLLDSENRQSSPARPSQPSSRPSSNNSTLQITTDTATLHQHVRKNSSVHARVKAMEAANGVK